MQVSFQVPSAGYNKVLFTTPLKAGNRMWYVEGVPAGLGQISVTATDLAGNSIVAVIPVRVESPFEGPSYVYLGQDAPACEDGRVISADLTRDGFDDGVLVCRVGLGGQLFAFYGTPNGLLFAQTMPWTPADDLVAADVDRDGDLDVVTVSWTPPAPAPATADFLLNDGTGNLVDPGISLALGQLERKTVRVIQRYGRTTPVLVVFGTRPAGADVVAFELRSGFPTLDLPGLIGVDGDWEVGDMDGNGAMDLVALGIDAGGSEALNVFWGAAGGWNHDILEAYSGASHVDVDLGDFNSDGQTDIFVMRAQSSVLHETKLLAYSGGTYSTFAEATTSELQIADGDGQIVDLESDGLAEVVAMGRTAGSAVATPIQGDIASWYLRNSELFGTMSEAAPAAMRALADTDTAWGDFDADGDLDLFQVGFDEAGIFHVVTDTNQIGDFIERNNAPAPPKDLTSFYDPVRGGYEFGWKAPGVDADETREAGFGYELIVSDPVTNQVLLSWAHPAGPSQQGPATQRFLKMPSGTYRFSVRTVDSGWRRSLPAGPAFTTP